VNNYISNRYPVWIRPSFGEGKPSSNEMPVECVIAGAEHSVRPSSAVG
jgi:hypothetical protein